MEVSSYENEVRQQSQKRNQMQDLSESLYDLHSIEATGPRRGRDNASAEVYRGGTTRSGAMAGKIPMQACSTVIRLEEGSQASGRLCVCGSQESDSFEEMLELCASGSDVVSPSHLAQTVLRAGRLLSHPRHQGERKAIQGDPRCVPLRWHGTSNH